jgi:hypothetical protein
MRKSIFASAALLAGVLTSTATVTVQGWWHLDTSQPINDSTTNSRTFGMAYSTAPATGGSVAAQVINNGASGPLDASGWTSTNCIQVGVGVGGKRQSSMWGTGYNPPAQNYGIEIWVLPQDNGIAGGTGGWIFSSGQAGGVALRINAPSGNPSYIDAYVLGPGTAIGNQVPIDTNRWMHLAIVNSAGVLTFYTNGIPCGSSLASGATASAGDMYCISAPGDNQAFYGYLDEARIFTFAAGAFTTNDFLLRPAGPNIIAQPQSAVVWANGAAPFTVVPSFDNSLLYQWQSKGTNLPGQNSATYYLNQVTTANSGSAFDCVVTGGGINVTSTAANLTVIANNPANVAAYQNAVKNEPSLGAYFPVDGDTGSMLTNVKDATHNGTLELGATYDGRTNDTFGARSLSFALNGDVQITNNPALEFGSGNGTVEALVYLSQATVSDPTIFSENNDGFPAPYYAFGVSANGGNLIYRNDQISQLTWIVPGGMVGKLVHVAWVFNNGTNVTAYANGQNLGTQTQTSFGSSPGAPLWIGGLGTSLTGNRWAGTVDELAVYTAALTQNTIQQHYSAFVYGTNTSSPSIVSQPSSRTVLAGASPVLVVQAGGTLPLSYQWSANGGQITGATSAMLAVSNVTTTSTYTLHVQNAYGSTNINPVVVTVAAPPSGYPAMVMNDHPTAFWRLSDTAGAPAVDSAGFNDGTYNTNGVTYGVPAHQGEGGSAVKLDGASGRAIVPYTPVLNPNGAFSCEFWALANQAFYVPVGSMPRQTQSRSGGYEFYLNGNYPGYEFHTAASGGYNMITGDDAVPATNQWFQVVGVYDGVSTIFCYVNGRPAATTSGNPGYSDSSPPFVPNSLAAFIIGSRQDNVRYFNGAISDVAFYNYALSPAQVSNHWTSAYFAAHVVSSPAGVTNTEFSTVTLSPVITGLPNTYQWYKDNSPLTPFLNFDGSPHYSQDVTNATLVIAEAYPADSGQYHVVVSNPLGGATSANATVLITADTNPPTVMSVQALATPPPSSGPWPFIVKVLFNTRIDPATGVATANYLINNGAVAVSQVTLRGDLQAPSLGTDWKVAFLQTGGLTPGQQYTLKVSGVKDQAQTPNTIAPQTITFTAPPLMQGSLSWDYYYEITPQSVSSLQGFTYYLLSAPTTNGYLTAFDTDQITGGDLNNNPNFGSLGDNYGAVVSGFLTPTVSGDYYFFLASDDASELDLSMDSSVANAAVIAVEPSCCHGFLEPNASNNSGQTTQTPISLKAGTNYFIRAFHTEGTGGDYVKVAWRLSTDNTPATNLTAIASQYLSTYRLAAPAFNPPVFSNGQLTISWTGTGTLRGSTNVVLPFSQWTTVTNTSPYHVTPASSGPRMFYRLTQ